MMKNRRNQRNIYIIIITGIFLLAFRCQMEPEIKIKENLSKEIPSANIVSHVQKQNNTENTAVQGNLTAVLDESKIEKNQKGKDCIISNFNSTRYGACTMELGFVYQGTECMEVRGCSCLTDCEKFFKTRQRCTMACMED